MKNKVVLVLASLLVGYGLLKPDLSVLVPQSNLSNSVVVVERPSDKELLVASNKVIQALKSGSSSRRNDGVRLSSLYYDLASLIELDESDEVVKSTLEIREANRLSGLLCRLNLSGKYPDLSKACNDLVVTGLGDDDVVLDNTIRKKAVDTFKALSWACLEGSK